MGGAKKGRKQLKHTACRRVGRKMTATDAFQKPTATFTLQRESSVDPLPWFVFLQSTVGFTSRRVSSSSYPAFCCRLSFILCDMDFFLFNFSLYVRWFSLTSGFYPPSWNVWIRMTWLFHLLDLGEKGEGLMHVLINAVRLF